MRENRDYLPGVALPAYLYPTHDPEEALEGAELAVLAVPSKALRETVAGLPPAPWYVSATKGLFYGEEGVRTPAEVVEALTQRPVVALSGPNHAEEVARFLPTASVAAGPEDLARRVQALFSGPTFRVYTSRDRRGVELGGAVKNVLALAAGMVDGLGLGDNAKAALLTRGLKEMVRFGTALGGEEATFYGLAGLGDLLATAYSLHSRNRMAGESLVRGVDREALEARGMKLILDGVFNHVGATHPWFQKALEDPSSPERGMFTFYPDGSYASFWGVKHMPKLDYASALTQERFVFGKEAPVRYWMRLAHGWRLDVAHSIGEGGTNRKNARWLRALARAAKEEREDALVFGELSYDTVPTLRAHTLDGAMHYAGFAHPVMEWLSGRDLHGNPVELEAEDLWRALFDHYAALPLQLRHAMYTLLSSHDIPRALWRLRGDKERFKTAYALLFAFPGSPAVYYGDEVGLSQPNPYEVWRGDPYCRAPFPWDEALWDKDLLAFLRRLILLKKTHPALRLGGLLPLKAPPGVLAFRRRHRGREVWAFFAKEEVRLSLPRGVDLLSGREVAGEVEARYLLLEPLE